ncbi:mediator of RNA polymerase II transcription subunit 8 isoform X1 [Salvia miltiorrhiza]|uniref:mediator of RNA polymerase II transcription subunit 8 isoform X1 n=1 Tax=Salvia miltiorrhiza TaxID=226208 RepID=UPI0025ACA9CE|nr:mediator of RNA polymerase II transcription subunit 8 isoform X1 [Salvia miltiorrhiza]
MAAAEAAVVAAGQDQQQPPPAKAVERLNSALQQQLNLDSVKTRAISLFKAISRILEELDAIARANATPKWQDVLGQFSMVNLELYNIVEDIKNVSKAFVVHPKNVNAENATILPVMLSSKLLPEMEMEDNTKREQLLHGMQGLPVVAQIDKLKTRIDMIGAACESAEKIIADARKTYFGTRQGTNLLPTIDKVQAAKIQEQENLLRSAVNHGEGLRVPGDQRQVASSLPMHLVDVLATNDNPQTFQDSSGLYQKSTPPLMSTATNNSQGSLLQASGAQLIGRPAASPSGPTTSFDNSTAASPMQYANSPRSGANIMNTPSPQQQQSQQQQLQQQRQKMLQQQLLSQQQLRPSSMPVLGQNQLTQLHDMPSQSQQKFQSMHGQHHVQFSQPLGAQQLQSRQLTSAAMQHMSPNQLNQGNQLNRQLNQFSSPANSALFNAAQATPTSQMIPNMSAMMPSQSILPRMQFAMSGANRTLTPQNLSDQMFNMGAANTGGMMPIQQQQQHSAQGAFGNMQQSAQNMQPGMVTMQNTQQNHPNFQQQRPQNQQ